MKDRIKTIRSSSGLNQNDFGLRIGVTGAAVSRWESGDRNVPDSAIRSICREFGVNETWLRTGDGDPAVSQTREQELAALFKRFMADKPESFRTALVSTLLRFEPDGPEWEALEKIYDDIAAQYGKSPKK